MKVVAVFVFALAVSSIRVDGIGGAVGGVTNLLQLLQAIPKFLATLNELGISTNLIGRILGGLPSLFKDVNLDSIDNFFCPIALPLSDAILASRDTVNITPQQLVALTTAVVDVLKPIRKLLVASKFQGVDTLLPPLSEAIDKLNNNTVLTLADLTSIIVHLITAIRGALGC